MERKYRLLKDKYSAFRSTHLYARAGDEVKLLKDCGNVWIVEKEDGDRFPLRPEEVEEVKEEKHQKSKPDEKPETSVPPKQEEAPAQRKAKRSVPPTQTNLF